MYNFAMYNFNWAPDAVRRKAFLLFFTAKT
nr:MAG TPA: hypothetical protein [Caudoviricetes sp.]